MSDAEIIRLTTEANVAELQRNQALARLEECRAQRRQAIQLLQTLHRDCIASDFNEHWESYAETEAFLKKQPK